MTTSIYKQQESIAKNEKARRVLRLRCKNKRFALDVTIQTDKRSRVDQKTDTLSHKCRKIFVSHTQKKIYKIYKITTLFSTMMSSVRGSNNGCNVRFALETWMHISSLHPYVHIFTCLFPVFGRLLLPVDGDNSR